MLRNSALRDWYDGKSELSGAPARTRAPPPAAEPNQARDIFGATQMRSAPPINPHRQRTDLAAFNDGSPLMMALAGKANNATTTGQRALRQVGTSALVHNEGLDQMGAWRMGDTTGFTLDGSAAREHKSDVPLDQQAAWRFGDASGFSLGEGTYQPIVQKTSGLGRKINPELMPFNDGSQMMMQTATSEQKAREKYLNVEHSLTPGCSAPLVEATEKLRPDDAGRFAGDTGSRTTHFRTKLASDLDQMASMRYNASSDFNPWTMDGRIPAPGSPGAREADDKNRNRKRTDLTEGLDRVSWGVAPDMPEGHVPPNYAVNKARWREGDTGRFSIDGAPAPDEKRVDIDKLSAWRFGDTMPWTHEGTIDASSSAAVEARRRAANSQSWQSLGPCALPVPPGGGPSHVGRDLATDNGRRTTDVVFHKDPSHASSRQLSIQSTAFADTYAQMAAAIDPEVSALNGGAVYGRGSSDVTRNAPTWGEVNRVAQHRQMKSSASLGRMPTQAELYQAERLERATRPAEVRAPLNVYSHAALGLARSPPRPHGLATSQSSGRLLQPRLHNGQINYS